MSDYQRFISYMNAYEGEIKEQNVGYVKVEERSGRGRIFISLKGVWPDVRSLEVYLVSRGGEGRKRQRIGRMELAGGQGEFSYLRETKAGEERLASLGGLLLTGEGTRFCFTGWDDEPVEWRELLGEEPETETPEPEPPEPEPPEPEPGDRENPLLKTAELWERTAQPEKGLWEILCRVYPVRLAGPEAAGWELREISLQDIGRLPRRCWIYGSNSFLVQAFYRYGHLVLMRGEKKGRPVYGLGVPGEDSDTEQMLAGLFGFRDFLPGSRRDKTPAGYWWTEIGLDEENRDWRWKNRQNCK